MTTTKGVSVKQATETLYFFKKETRESLKNLVKRETGPLVKTFAKRGKALARINKEGGTAREMENEMEAHLVKIDWLLPPTKLRRETCPKSVYDPKEFRSPHRNYGTKHDFIKKTKKIFYGGEIEKARATQNGQALNKLDNLAQLALPDGLNRIFILVAPKMVYHKREYCQRDEILLRVRSMVEHHNAIDGAIVIFF